MTDKLRALALAAVLAVLSAGCLLKDRTDTWYLDSNGAVMWSVIEKDVRSDAKAPADRQTEEQNYLAAVRSQTHPIARAFMALGATEVKTRILRASVPLTVVTEGRFASIDSLGDRIIRIAGVTGFSRLDRTPDATQWTISIRDPRSADGVGPTDEEVQQLLEGLERLSVVLTSGRFSDGSGFDLSSDARVATLAQDKTAGEAFDAGLAIVKTLKWSVK